MKLSFAILALVALIIGGCGASKDYVAEQIQASESQMEAKIANVRETAEANEAEISKLRSLAGELQEKTDMAINEAKGFENYQVIWSGEINFPFDSWEITGAAEQTLMDAGDKMTQYPGSIIEIAGHTDRTGPAKYNLMLGEERADAAKRFLADKFGISFYRMFKMSYGESKPTAMPDEKNSASRNRRVTLKIWGNM